MKALSVWQVWASLLACGAKRIETRDWSPPTWLVGERIAIHASKRRVMLHLSGYAPFGTALREADSQGRLALVQHDLPLGALLGTAVLRDVVVMTEKWIADLRERDEREFVFGHFAPGRRAWVLDDVQAFREPVPFRGRQGVFDVPDEVLPTDLLPVGAGR